MSLLCSDTYGFYTYNGKKTYSKYQVMLDEKNPSDIHWYYNDDFFDQFDWKTEPVKSLDELYKDRVEQLRNQYDYLILMYSGGSDSDNILHSFVKNKIHLDEICHMTNIKGSESENNLVNREIFELAIPKVKYLIEKHNLKTKQRFYDLTEDYINFFNTNQSKDFFNFCNCSTSPFTFLKPYASSLEQTHVHEWKQIVSSGKKLAIIHGCDKPMITHKNNRFFFNYCDSLSYHFSIKSQMEEILNNNCVDELFYWGANKESVNIVIKQSHIIKNFIGSPIVRKWIINEHKPDAFQEFNCWYYDQNNNLECRFGGNILKNLIYPSWNDISDPFESIKKKYIMDIKPRTSVLNFEKDSWFFSKENEDSVKNFLIGIRKYKKTIHGDWILKKPGQSKYMSVKGEIYPRWIRKIRSKNYYLD